MDKNILNKKDEIKKLCLKYNILLFTIFGSRGTNNFTKNSDYDFAFYSNNIIDKNELQNELELIFKNAPIDLVNLNKDDNPILANEIFTKGIVIYSKSNEILEDLTFKSWADYIDIKPLIDEAKNQLTSM